jgi:hypothetical protein
MAYTTRIAWETLRSFDSATLSGAYQTIGTPLQQDSYILKLVNNSNVLVTISLNGINDIDVAPANSFWLYDEYKSDDREAVPQGTQIFVKSAAPIVGVGLIYLVSQYLVKS